MSEKYPTLEYRTVWISDLHLGFRADERYGLVSQREESPEHAEVRSRVETARLRYVVVIEDVTMQLDGFFS